MLATQGALDALGTEVGDFPRRSYSSGCRRARPSDRVQLVREETLGGETKGRALAAFFGGD